MSLHSSGRGGARPAPAETPAVESRRSRELPDVLRAGSGMVELLMFRVGRELFAAELAAVEEALELPLVERLPQMPAMQLGIFTVRGRMMPLFSPERALGVASPPGAGAALVVRVGDHRIAIAVDDVIDVLSVDASRIREAPALHDPSDILLGVTRRGTDLIAVIDARALVAACLDDRALETA